MPRGPSQPPPKQPREERTTAEILTSARETFQTVEYGLGDLLGHDASRKMTGLRNLVVFGRAVTNVLQNLKSVEPSFEGWYTAKQREMRADDLLKFFYELRSRILKRGSVGHISTSTHINHLDGSDLARLTQNPPPGATSFFIGDPLGGSGWRVALPDGSIEKYYVALPDDLAVEVRLHFQEPPATHQGDTLDDRSVEALAQHYVEYLRGLLADADSEFG